MIVAVEEYFHCFKSLKCVISVQLPPNFFTLQEVRLYYCAVVKLQFCNNSTPKCTTSTKWLKMHFAVFCWWGEKLHFHLYFTIFYNNQIYVSEGRWSKLCLAELMQSVFPVSSLCRYVQLNGEKLLMDNETLPELKPKTLRAGRTIAMPPMTIGFYVIKNINAYACRR